MSDTQPNETNSDWTKEVSDNLMKLAFMAADHGIDSVRASSGPLIPFMIIEGEKRELRRYVTENVEDGLVKAREAASSLNSNTKAYAIAHDGYITLQDGIYDAIIIEAAERNASTGFLFAQRYLPKKGLFSRFKTVGNTMLAGKTEQRLK